MSTFFLSFEHFTTTTQTTRVFVFLPVSHAISLAKRGRKSTDCLDDPFFFRFDKIPFPPLQRTPYPPSLQQKNRALSYLRNTFCTTRRHKKGSSRGGFWFLVFFFPWWNTFTYVLTLIHQSTSSHVKKERAKVHNNKKQKKVWFCVGTTQKSSS